MTRFLDWLRAHLLALLTGKDGKTLDPARVSGMVALVVLVVATIWKLIAHEAPSLQDIATAFGIQTLGTGGGAALTNNSQPQPDTTAAVADTSGNGAAVTTGGG